MLWGLFLTVAMACCSGGFTSVSTGASRVSAEPWLYLAEYAAGAGPAPVRRDEVFVAHTGVVSWRRLEDRTVLAMASRQGAAMRAAESALRAVIDRAGRPPAGGLSPVPAVDGWRQARLVIVSGQGRSFMRWEGPVAGLPRDLVPAARRVLAEASTAAAQLAPPASEWVQCLPPPRAVVDVFERDARALVIEEHSEAGRFTHPYQWAPLDGGRLVVTPETSLDADNPVVVVRVAGHLYQLVYQNTPKTGR